MAQTFGSSFWDLYAEKTKSLANTVLNGTSTYSTYKNNKSMWNMDMAKKSTCTVMISEFSNSKIKHSTYGAFMPIKSIEYTPFEVGYESIDTGIYGSLPLLSNLTNGKISLTIYDTDHDIYEMALYIWYDSCKPKGGYVPYMSDIIRSLEYKGYTNKGVVNSHATFNVIPSGSYSVSKDYSDDELKTISFDLTVVGEPVTFNIDKKEDDEGK